MRNKDDRDRFIPTLGMWAALLVLAGCGVGKTATLDSPRTVVTSGAEASEPEERRMWMTVGDRRFAVTLADNAAARAFATQLPLTLEMEELNGNEKHAQLPQALPAKASRPGTIRNGDLMLYGSKTLVLFYLTFNSSYSYTRLGRVDDPADLPQLLGRGSIRVAFSRE